MKRLRMGWILLALLVAASAASAQDGFFSSWENRVRSTMADQPAWPVPLFAPSATVTQLFRYDIVRQITPAETTTWNYGFSKGVNLVPGIRPNWISVFHPTSGTIRPRRMASETSAWR